MMIHRRNFRGTEGSGLNFLEWGTDPHFISTPRAWSSHFSDQSYATVMINSRMNPARGNRRYFLCRFAGDRRSALSKFLRLESRV